MKHSFSDAGDLRKYFAAIPNLVFSLGLNPYELALYAHFKQAAGDSGGVCWKSRATIAKESGMSSGMVSKARIALEKPRPELSGQSLITATEQPHEKGGKPTWHIKITDVWAVNMVKYSPSPRDVVNQPLSVSVSTTSPRAERRHHTRESTSPDAHKEKPIKKNPEEEDRNALFLGSLKTNPTYSFIDIDREIGRMQAWLALPANRGRRLTSRFVLGWLNKIDPPLVVSNGNGNGHKGMSAADVEAMLHG